MQRTRDLLLDAGQGAGGGEALLLRHRQVLGGLQVLALRLLALRLRAGCRAALFGTGLRHVREAEAAD